MKAESTSLVCDLCGRTIKATNAMHAEAERVFIMMGQHGMVDKDSRYGEFYQRWPIDPISNNGRDHVDVCKGCCTIILEAAQHGIVSFDIRPLEQQYLIAQRVMSESGTFNTERYMDAVKKGK